jgi:Lrp/AsnC family leucine-responsive transcriptional regulator
MDSTDLKILELLQRDGRASHADIAKQVGLSPPAVGERIRRLEGAGIVRRYAAILNPARAGRTVSAFVAVSLDKPIHAKAFLQRIRELDDILECHHMTGDDCYLLKVRARSLAALESLISNDLRPLEGVVRTHTTVILSSFKEETRLGLTLQDLSGYTGGGTKAGT